MLTGLMNICAGLRSEWIAGFGRLLQCATDVSSVECAHGFKSPTSQCKEHLRRVKKFYNITDHTRTLAETAKALSSSMYYRRLVGRVGLRFLFSNKPVQRISSLDQNFVPKRSADVSSASRLVIVNRLRTRPGTARGHNRFRSALCFRHQPQFNHHLLSKA